MGSQLSNAPVYYVLAQAKFNPVNNMKNYVDVIQDRLRRLHFSVYEEQLIEQIHVVTRLGVPPEARQRTETIWHFTRKDQTAGFVLTPSQLVYHTTHYQTDEQFLPVLLSGLSIVHEVVELEYVDRLGLRYLNAILPTGDELLDDYLMPGVRGISPVGDMIPARSISESIFQRPLENTGELATLVARIYRTIDRLGYPPDVAPNQLVLKPQFQQAEVCEHAVVDTDHWIEANMPVDREQLLQRLMVLHDGLKLAFFDAIITEQAQEKWV